MSLLMKTTRVRARMMHQTGRFAHTKNTEMNDTTVLAMPFKGETLDMILFLPSPNSCLQAMEKQLENINMSKTLTDLIQSQKKEHVTISIPKFMIESGLSLTKPLEKNGVKELFNVFNADLSGISGQEDLFVSLVVQKACIEVDEGSTGFPVQAEAELMDTLRIDFDRPFHFMVRERLTGLVICSGRVVNPLLQ